MRTPMTALVALALVQGAAAQELCGKPASLPSPEVAQIVSNSAGLLSVSAQSGDAFARHAQEVHRIMVAGRSPEEAQLMTVALLQGYCEHTTHDLDPARLPQQVADRFAGLGKLAPEVKEAQALVERIKAAGTMK